MPTVTDAGHGGHISEPDPSMSASSDFATSFLSEISDASLSLSSRQSSTWPTSGGDLSVDSSIKSSTTYNSSLFHTFERVLPPELSTRRAGAMAGRNPSSSSSSPSLNPPAIPMNTSTPTPLKDASIEVEAEEDIAALLRAPLKEYTGYGQLPSTDYIFLTPLRTTSSSSTRRPRLDHRAQQAHSFHGHGRRVSGGLSSASTSRINFHEDGFGYGLCYWNAAAATKQDELLILNGLFPTYDSVRSSGRGEKGRNAVDWSVPNWEDFGHRKRSSREKFRGPRASVEH